MSKLSLKVVVAGRTYPLTVNESEKERVLKAAEDINKSIQLLQVNYAVKDMQDLLAMTALQLATKSPDKPLDQNQVNDHLVQDVKKKLDLLCEELNQYDL